MRIDTKYYNFSKKGFTYSLQKELKNEEMNHDEVFEKTWRNQTCERLDYVKSDVSCTTFDYARYSNGMKKIAALGSKDCFNFSFIRLETM